MNSRSPDQNNLMKMIKYPFSFLLLLISMTVAGCGDSSTGTEYDENGNGNDVEQEVRGPNDVWMQGTSFVPGNLEVEAGTTVTWTNKSAEIHTVTSGEAGEHDNLFDSGDMTGNATFQYTFDDTGVFDYFCRPHVSMGMTGTITVVENEEGNNDGGNGGNNPGGNDQDDDYNDGTDY